MADLTDTANTGENAANPMNDVPDEFEVEGILNKRKYRGKLEYLIKWRGYPNSEATWEPRKNLSCDDLINTYEAKLTIEKAVPPTAPRRGEKSMVENVSTNGAGRESRKNKRRATTPPPVVQSRPKRQSRVATENLKNSGEALEELRRMNHSAPIHTNIGNFSVLCENDAIVYHIEFDLDGYENLILRVEDKDMQTLQRLRAECTTSLLPEAENNTEVVDAAAEIAKEVEEANVDTTEEPVAEEAASEVTEAVENSVVPEASSIGQEGSM